MSILQEGEAVTLDLAAVQQSPPQWDEEKDRFGSMLKGCGIFKHEWAEKSVEAAAGLNDTGIDRVFVIAAAGASHHLDYVKQAPVIAVQLSSCAPLDDSTSNKYLASITERIFCGGPRLKDVLRNRRIARPLRAVHSSVWRESHAHLLPYFWEMPTSTLAQAIPKKKTKQHRWLQNLDSWVRRICRLGIRQGDVQSLTNWACVALADGKQRRDIDVIADFARTCPARFTSKWTWDKAAEECEAWHRDVAKKKDREAFLKQHGIGWEEKIDYLPLPSRRELNGLTFEALQSGEDIHIEGSVMRHCVASYIDRVVKRASFIYSVRLGTKRLATLEISPSSPTRLKVAQIKGPCNSKTPRDVIRAAESFVDGINKQLSPERAP